MDENQETTERGQGHAHDKPDKDFHIIVNGRPKTVSADSLSFTEVVALAYDPLRTEPGALYTVSFSCGPKENPEGDTAASVLNVDAIVNRAA